MYAIMKLEYEAPIYDYFSVGALKGGILKWRLDWGIPEKKKTGGGEGVENMHIWKNPWDFLFFYSTLGNPGQNKAPPMEIPQNYVTNLCYIP